MDTLKSGQPPYNGHTVCPQRIYCPYISTSEEGTTSEQLAKCSSPMCPLFGGSTVNPSLDTIEMEESVNVVSSLQGLNVRVVFECFLNC